ncbi:uncharacterized protein LOC123532202 [Mercenaria mercenaria]|uniref:uncharacterized protein LOC123532202 n=1 Tax=Mercenaria mercenaria TaxID=6596 RepID=UPI00234E5FF4|nr:uncharacterized protein LOC123532202 [Mercenaria mercenaria]
MMIVLKTMDIGAFSWLFVSIFLSCLSVSNGQGVCTGITPCNCKFENGQFLHLDGIARTDGAPRFVNVSDKHEMSYSWNPCFNFTEGACKEVAMCGIQPSIPHDLYLSLGYQSTANFITNQSDNSVTLVYKTQGNPLRTSYVSLICVKGDVKDNYFKAIGQKQQLSTDFYFELRSPLACPQGEPIVSSTPKPSSSHNTALEAGLITVSIVAFALMVALTTVVLKMKVKICKDDKRYDEL